MRFGDLSAPEKKIAVARSCATIEGLKVGDMIEVRGRKYPRPARVSRINDAGMRFIKIWSDERWDWMCERKLYPVDLIF